MVMFKKIAASGELEIVETTGQKKPEGGPMIVKTGGIGRDIKKGDKVSRNGVDWVVVSISDVDNTKMVRLVSCMTGDEEILMLSSLLNEIGE